MAKAKKNCKTSMNFYAEIMTSAFLGACKGNDTTSLRWLRKLLSRNLLARNAWDP